MSDGGDDGDDDDDEMLSISSSLDRRRVSCKRGHEDAVDHVLSQLFTMDSRELCLLNTDEILTLTNDMLDWMLGCGDGDSSMWPRKLFLLSEQDMLNTSIMDVEETKVKYMHLFFRIEQIRKDRVKTESQNAAYKLAKVMGNVNRCRAFVVGAYSSITPLCLMMHKRQAGGGYNIDDESNQGILQTIASDKDMLKDVQTLVQYLLDVCLMRPYKKHDGFIYEQKSGNTHYWHRKYDFKTFIHTECAYENDEPRWRLMTNCKSNVEQIEEQLRSGIYEHYLPTLRRDRTVWSWHNGVYDAKHDRFYAFETDTINIIDDLNVLHISKLPDSVVACRHFPDKDFNYFAELKGDFASGQWWDIPTPSFDRILNYQQLEHDVQRCIWSMACGRMQHDMQDVDNKQVICFFVGMAGTGKSIWIDSINYMYEHDDVGVIANKGQQTFCLDGMEDKFIWHISEVTSQFNLCQAKFQQIVSGESILIDRKHKTSITVLWRAPGIMAGNETPAFSDNAGSIARRTCAVRFEQTLDRQHLDTSLPQKMKDEVATMILKGNRAFQSMNMQYKGKSFWDFAPVYFNDTQMIMKASTNALVAFMASGRVAFSKGEYVREREFKETFYAYCKDNGLDFPKWTTDYYMGPLGSKQIQIGKNNNGKHEKLPWPKVQRRYMDGAWVDEKGSKSHSKFFHNCELVREYDDNEVDVEDN